MKETRKRAGKISVKLRVDFFKKISKTGKLLTNQEI